MNVVIAIIILGIYTLTLIKIGGSIPPSLSESIFNISPKYRWIWTIVICTICFLCVPTYIEKTSENTQFLAFLSIAGLAFVGAAPLVKWKDNALQFNIHEKGAIICAICSQLVLAFNNYILLIPWIAYISFGFGRTWKDWKTMIFWGEILCFYITFIYCLI